MGLLEKYTRFFYCGTSFTYQRSHISMGTDLMMDWMIEKPEEQIDFQLANEQK